jgi:hypothetical protein
MKLKTMGLFVGVVAATAVAAIMWSGDAMQVSHAEESDANVVAKIGDNEVTMAELDARAKRSNTKVNQDQFDARNQALNEMIAENLLRAEAATRGITPDELVTQEIIQKMATATDAEIETFFKTNSGRMGGRTLDEMKGQISNFLQSENRRKARVAYIGGLRAKNKVSVFLDPPRATVQIASTDPKQGPDGAVVKIIEFSDFQ